MSKIKIAVALLFILSIALTVLFYHTNTQNKTNSTLLDTINEQKAFTQEISKNIFYIYKNKSASTKQLDNSIKKFILNMNNKETLLKQTSSNGVKKQSKKIVLLWNNFYLHVQKFRDNSKVSTAYSGIILEKIVKDIYNINLDLVIEFNSLLKIQQAHFENSIDNLKTFQYILLSLLILVLIYLFSQLKATLNFIQKFLYTSKNIITNSSIKELKPLEVTNSNYDILHATTNFNILVNKIDNSILNSSKSIEHSYKSLEHVEENIENLLEFLSEMDDNKEIDRELTKKEDALIQSLEELTTTASKLKNLKADLDNLTSSKK